MGFTREEQELALRVSGQAELAALVKQLEQEEKALAKAAAARTQDAASQAAWEAQVKQAAPLIEDLQVKIAALKGDLAQQAAAARKSAADFVAAEREKAEAAKKAADEIEAARLKEIANRGASGSAWGGVFQNANAGAVAAREDAKAKQELADASARAATEVDKLGAETFNVAAAEKRATAAAEEFARAVKKKGDDAKEATGKLAGLGQAGLQIGRAVQDFAQGGLGGILNNIEGIVRSIGMGPGVAGVLTMAGVAAMVFGDKIKAAFNIKEPIDAALTNVGRLEKQIKELQEKPAKLAIDVSTLRSAQENLDKLKRDLANFQELQNQKTSRERRAGAAIEGALAEANGPVLSEQLRDAASKRLIKADPQLTAIRTKIEETERASVELNASLKNAALPGQSEQIINQLAKLDKNLKEARDNEQKRLDAIRGPKGEAETAVGRVLEEAKRGKVGGLADLAREAGRGQVADALEQNTPEALEAQDKARTKIGHAVETFANPRIRNLGERVKLNVAMGEHKREEAARQRDVNARIEAAANLRRAAKAKGAPSPFNRPTVPGPDGEASPTTPAQTQAQARAEGKDKDLNAVNADWSMPMEGSASAKGPKPFTTVYNTRTTEGRTAKRRAENKAQADRRESRAEQRKIDREQRGQTRRLQSLGPQMSKSRGLIRLMPKTPTERFVDPGQQRRMPAEPLATPTASDQGQTWPQPAPGGPQQAQGFAAYHQANMQALQGQQAQAAQLQAIIAAATQQLQAFGTNARSQWQATQVQSYSYAPNYWG